MASVMTIHCCGCGHAVHARLTNGREIYPHRSDLAEFPFWRCDACKNYVGCHYKTRDRTKPLGNIPTPEIKRARQHIHAILDPLWKSGRMARGKLYAMISERIGRQYHTAEVASIDEAREVYRVVREIAKSADRGNVKVGIDAPRETAVHREEVYERIKRENERII